MTLVEIKTKEALDALGIGTSKEVTSRDLQFVFLGLERKYSPEYTQNELYKDGVKFNELKAYYEYVSSDICRTNEAIRNIIDPDNATYEYQDNPNINTEVINELEDSNNTNSSYNSLEGSSPNQYGREANLSYTNEKPTYNPNAYYDYQMQDKVSIMTVMLIFLFPLYGLVVFFMFRKIKPKSSKWYLFWTIIGFILNFIANYYLVQSGYYDSLYGA